MRVGYRPDGGRIKTDGAVAIDRGFLAHVSVSAADAIAADVAGVLAATALAAATQEITANITDPAVPRNITITGNQAGIAGDVTVHGTNCDNETISETIALNGAATVEGNKAFKTVTQVDLPVETNAGTDTVSVGWGDKLGVPFKLDHDTVLKAYLGDVLEGTDPTVATDADNVEGNTVDLDSALDGSKVDVYLVV